MNRMTAQATEESEAIMIRTQDGSMADIREIGDSDLYEIHLSHAFFVDSLIYIIGEAFQSPNDPEGVADRFSAFTIEIDERFDYIKKIGYELYRRLNSQKSKAV